MLDATALYNGPNDILKEIAQKLKKKKRFCIAHKLLNNKVVTDAVLSPGKAAYWLYAH